MKRLPKISPLTLTRRREPLDHPDWIFELKHDGFRALAYITEDGCSLVSRRDNTFRRFPSLNESFGNLPVKSAILDGEIVCLDAEGNSLFNELLFRRGQPYFYAFDLVFLNDLDLRTLPLLKRKEYLRTLLRSPTVQRFSMLITSSTTGSNSFG